MYILGAIDAEYKYSIINNYYEVIVIVKQHVWQSYKNYKKSFK